MKKIVLLIIFFNLWYLVGCSKPEEEVTQSNSVATAKNEIEKAIAKERVEEYLRPYGLDVTKNEALSHWIAQGDLDAVSALLAAGADPKSSNKYGITPLMEACFIGGDVLKQRNPEIARLLLEAGADPNAVGKDGVTALSLAISYAQHETIPLLLQAGANPNIRNNAGKTPLYYATDSNTVRSLLEAGAEPNIRDNAGKTPLYYAMDSNTVRSLLEAGAEPNMRDSKGQTPLLSMLSYLNNNSHFYAVDSGDLYSETREDAKEVITFLLKYGADPNISDKKGNTPLQFARNIDENLVNLLKQAGAKE